MSNSESFTDDSIPRHAPRPSISFAETLATPTVPEVSLILDRTPVAAEPPAAAPTTYKSYSAWKKETEKSPLLDSPSMTKKQVRFVPVSSSLQSQQMYGSVGYSTPPLIKSEAYSQPSYGPRYSPGYMSSSAAAAQYSKPKPSPPIVNQCCTTVVMPTEARQDYMTPKSHLLPQSTNFQTPTTSHPRMPHVVNHIHHSPSTLIGELHSNSCEPSIDEGAPTVTTKKEFDILYDMLERQSSQIQMLQHHIELLLTQRRDYRTSTINQTENVKPKVVTAEKGIQCEIDDELDSKRRLSVGVNTSFEFNVQTNEGTPRKENQIVSNRKFVLNCDEKENINLSFYGNVMGEVHEIRENAGCNSCKCQNGNASSSIVKFATNTKERDKIFPQTAYNDETPKSPINIAIKPCLQIMPQPSTERSMAMSALALKYLPDEKLNQLTVPGMQKITPTNGLDPSKPLNEMSLITMAYMKKYGLINSLENDCNYVDNHQHLNYNDDKRFLDVTAIRRQPKLM